MAAYYQPAYQPLSTGYDPASYQYSANPQYTASPSSFSSHSYFPSQQQTPNQNSDSVPLVDKKSPNVSINSVFNRSSRSLQKNYTTKSRPKSWWWHILSHIVSFLWVVPIISMLVLNWTHHIIGSSVWCPMGHCSSNSWEEDAVTRAAKLDRDDHNTLGALQFVSKMLEVWFMLIATALVYDLAMIMARMEGGLPIGFILTHLEFMDVRNLLNRHLWTSPIPHRGASRTQKKSILRLFLFSVFVAFLTIIANLMGPAAAVLVLPTLQWIDTPHLASQVYHNAFFQQPPQGDSALDGCNATDLAAGNFSCTYVNYGPSLEQFAASALLTVDQSTKDFALDLASTSQESAVVFLVNATMESNLAWAPNRQVLQEISKDLFKYAMPEKWGKPPTPLNDSLSIVINREGPSVGFNAYCSAGNVSVTNVADDKQIACFDGWSIDGINNYTKCYRVGQGFGATNKASRFHIDNYAVDSNVNNTAVDVFFSDKATYYNPTTDFNSGIKACLSASAAPSCDWDRIFSTPVPSDLRNMSTNVAVTSYSMIPAFDPSEMGAGGPSARLFCDHVSYINFPTYTFDASTSTNPLQLVRMTNLELKNPDPIVMDPDWFLATWSVDRNGSASSYHKMSQEIMRTVPLAWADGMSNTSYFAQEMNMLQLYSLTQMMSMVRWRNTTLPSPSSSSTPSLAPTDTVLKTWATRHVWAYSLNSRTSKLGAAVVLTGCACVLFRLFLGAFFGKREHSPIDLFVAALQHQPQGEFDGMHEKDGSVGSGAKVRYVMEEDENGKPRFVPERSYMGDFGREATRGWSWGRRSTWRSLGSSGGGGGGGAGNTP
ncbi:uncharacterized protein KY384_001291 [Bacidia gigantensis]|uniref:uncharacterized protein n=1 Tax=Bacidia gigantensis TaxID=2732470 RepID=UPI001D0378A4|nr:uncharacterized protein KY384_001291 [Bacidia gigantensis]KAG8533551.1 hypothetical protein KY384_001291 [Bacidia gigantensis]